MSAVEAIAVSGAVAGVLDICATGAVMKAQGVPFGRLLQFVASGALGSSALEGGGRTATVGLALHFLIAGLWAFVYSVAGSAWPVLLARPALWGLVFGMLVHLVMSRAVVPLSRAPKRPFAWKSWLTQLVIHIVCVGVPIALVQGYLLR
jgi:hypothetical protein